MHKAVPMRSTSQLRSQARHNSKSSAASRHDAARPKRGIPLSLIVLGLALLGLGITTSLWLLGQAPSSTRALAAERPQGDAPPGMVWIPGGEFTMGGDDPLARPDESPKHRVRVDGFFIDITEVTNAQFAEFVRVTGYKTVAERPVDWEELKKQLEPGTPKPPDEKLQPGSLVFTPPDHAVDLRDMSGWWTWTIGASWRHPEGPNSTLEGRDDYPVVQVSWRSEERR